MILPTIRASLSRSDAQHLIGLLGRSEPDLGESASVRLERHGLDSVLDDRRRGRDDGLYMAPALESGGLESVGLRSQGRFGVGQLQLACERASARATVSSRL